MKNKQITMYEAIGESFEKVCVCKLCRVTLNSITKVSVHWRKTNQHDTGIKIMKVKVPKNGGGSKL